MSYNSITVIKAVEKLFPSLVNRLSYQPTQLSGEEWLDPIDGLSWENIEEAKPTWAQVLEVIPVVELETAKAAKLKELTRYYASEECWMFKLASAYLGASLSNPADWFAKVLPACANQTFYLLTDAGGTIEAQLTAEQASAVNYKITIEISYSIKVQKFVCLNAINSATTVEEVSAIDVKEILGATPRVVDLDAILGYVVPPEDEEPEGEETPE